MLIENVVLRTDSARSRKASSFTYVDWHLVHVNALLDTEFRYQYIEGSIQDADDSSLPDDWTIPLSQIRNENTEVQMGGLLLCKSGAFLLAVNEEISRYLKRV